MGEVEGRTWLGRFLKASMDVDGLKELAEKIKTQARRGIRVDNHASCAY